MFVAVLNGAIDPPRFRCGNVIWGVDFKRGFKLDDAPIVDLRRASLGNVDVPIEWADTAPCEYCAPEGDSA